MRFAAVGVRAALCLGETDLDARRAARERLASGELDVVLTCRALLEGWDCPAVDAVMFCGQAGSLGSWLQGCGRGLRSHPGKVDCLVLDLRGYVWLHGLPSDPRRCSLEGKAGRAAGEVLPALRRCRACFAISRPSSVCPRCGESFPLSARAVTHGNGRLVEVSTVPDPVRARKYLDALVERFARGRGASVARWRIEQRALMAAPDWVRAALH